MRFIVLAIAPICGARLASGAGVDGCDALARDSGAYVYHDLGGIQIMMIPYNWCLDNCAGWTSFPPKSIALIIFQFILPIVLFALVIPRKWHADLAHRSFDKANNVFGFFSRVLLSLVGVTIVASIDMIIWISVILTLAGPMILSGIEEMYLDFVSIRALQKNNLTSEERMSIIVALLCGNFEDHGNGGIADLRNMFSTYAPTTPGIPTLRTTKARLSAIMNGQASFGSTVGIATLFFLAGFLYNALGITDDTVNGSNWTPYAIWLMTMVFVAVISATLLTGNNPSVATVLVSTDYQLDCRPWWHLLTTDYYEGELCPVTTYDRGIRKMSWLLDSIACKNHQLYLEALRLDRWMALAWIGIPTFVFTLFPTIMAYSMAHRLPHPRQGCRTFTYLLYLSCQIVLVIIAMQRNKTGKSLFSMPGKNVSWNCLYWTTIGSVILLAFAVSFLGSIFQIFGVYNNCFCQTPASEWTLPASQRWTGVAFSMTDEYEANNRYVATTLTWAAALVTGVVCFLGFWYQKMLRRAVAVEIYHC